MITNDGMIDSPRQELRLEAEERLRRLGCEQLAVREADTPADAAVDVMVSDCRGWARFDRLAEEFRDRDWLDHLGDPMTGFLRWRRYGNHHPGYFRTELSGARRLPGLETVEAHTSGAAR